MSMVLELHRSILAVLRDDIQLGAMLNTPDSVFERVPPNRQFPCIVVEQSAASLWNTDSDEGRDVIVSLGVWSRANNRAEIYAIADRAIEVLEADFETPPNLNVVLGQMLTATYTRETAERAYRGTIRMRFLLEPSTP